jgi:hypothetical protein
LSIEPGGADRLELGRSQVIKLGEEMAVMVIGEGDTRVAGPSRDLRGIDARGREQSDSGVFQVVLKPMSA